MNESLQGTFELLLKGRFRDAENVCVGILQTHPNHPGALRLCGLVCHRQGRSEEAVELLRASVGVNSADPDVFHSLGMALRSLGEINEAIETLRIAIAADPGPPECHYNLGIALGKRGDVVEAIGAYRTAIRLCEKYDPAYGPLSTGC